MSEDSLGVSGRIEELKEKFEKDPNSKIFLQLAEEYRKAHRFEDAIQVCLAGLKKHPTYTSARVTLGRAFIGAKRAAEAKAEFQVVIAQVPDNILANRSLGDLYFEEGKAAEALERYRVVLMLSPNDDEVTARVRSIEGGGGRAAPSAARAAVPAAADAPGGTGDEAFMDLRIDESIVINADMIKATLKQAGHTAPPVAPPRPAPGVPPVKAPTAPAASKAAPAPVPAEVADAMSFEGMDGGDEIGGGFDDFSDFSSPTVMLNAADFAKMAEAASSGKPAEPASSFSSRTADKFGLASAAPEAKAAPAPAPAPKAPVKAPPPPAPEVDEFAAGEMGMGQEDFSEFAAPTVMLNVSDLIKSGALSEDMLKSKPFGVVEGEPAAGAPAGSMPPEAVVGGGADAIPEAIEAGADDFSSFANSFADDSPFSDATEEPLPEAPVAEVYGTRAFQPAEEFGTRAFQADELGALAAKSRPQASLEPQATPPAELSPLEAVEASFAPEPIGASPFMEEADAMSSPLEPEAAPSPWWTGSAAESAAPVGLQASESPWPAPEAASTEEEDVTSKTLGQLYLQQGHLDKALEVFEKYLAIHPGDAEVRDKVGEITRRLQPVTASVEPAPAQEAGAAASADGGGSADERKARIRQKLTSWLASTKKT